MPSKKKGKQRMTVKKLRRRLKRNRSQAKNVRNLRNALKGMAHNMGLVQMITDAIIKATDTEQKVRDIINPPAPEVPVTVPDVEPVTDTVVDTGEIPITDQYLDGEITSNGSTD